jgi:NTE family protein
MRPRKGSSTMDAVEPAESLSDGKIAIALSGGGARAMAFHLGCLRALHDAGLLERVATISSVSGGSVLAALYCHHPGDFATFEATARGVLARGFVSPALRIALTTPEGVKALANTFLIAVDRLAAFIVRLLLHTLRIHGWVRFGWLQESSLRRRFSRTTILRRVFSELFGGDTLPNMRSDRPKLIIVACELQAKSAFYFAHDLVGSWRLGSADPAQVEIAHAVAASAAYPGLLPALDGNMTFEKDGKRKSARIVLTDGGVYDNLGLAPLWPDRDSGISLHVDRYDRIVACRAGYALQQSAPPSLWPSRMYAVLESIHARAQNLAMNRLFDLQRARAIHFILPYLDQKDEALTCPPCDLVRRDSVTNYPTDFSAMSKGWLDKLVKRGEQLTQALLAEHWPDIVGAIGRQNADSGPQI